jgi:hypothetical protein
MSHLGNQESATSFERDEPTVEEVIDRGRQEKTILCSQTLLIVAIAPRLDVTGAQVLGALDPGDAAV